MSGMFSSIKKMVVSFVVIVSFAVYAMRQHLGGVEVVLPLPTPSPVETFVPTAVSNTTKGMYRDGKYTGAIADAYYGPLQVKAIIQGGKLVDVQFLQYPNDRGTSIEINSQALPLLKAEAIRIQKAQVDGVTGASATSPAFVQSLTSALAQAK